MKVALWIADILSALSAKSPTAFIERARRAGGQDVRDPYGPSEHR
ncbi:MAG: hypothetical protein QOK48_3759 [Blastocatellia bacterium]|jgi:hypothetical protein|nr:hypothetical protein [Blastocatellia bacterium]